jgi:endo-1,4-beta-mannosidase
MPDYKEVELKSFTLRYQDTDVVNPDDYIAKGDFNPHNVRPWLINNEFGTLAIVYASCEQDALDAAVDAGKMDSQQVSEEDLAEMSEEEREELLTAGNASEYFYQDYLAMVELPNAQYGITDEE